MSVNIEFILPLGNAPVHHGFTILGVANEAHHNIQVYYEIPANGVQSANLRTVTDAQGKWSVAFPGDFKVGTEITAFARKGSAELAWLTKVL